MRSVPWPQPNILTASPAADSFSEGVLQAEKDFNLPKHPEIDVPNLQARRLISWFASWS